MGESELFLSPFGPCDLDFPLESDLPICKTLSPGICVLSSLRFLYIEFPSNEAILEAMMMDF
jgi:hypothetical protein